MAKTQIILNGSAGRMGAALMTLLKNHPHAELAYAVDPKKRDGAVTWAGVKASKQAVIIDFSSLEGALAALEWGVKNKVPVVSGTTGLTPGQMKKFAAAAKNIPVLWSPNTSLGVNLFVKMIEALGKNLKGFDMQISEFHHWRKKDAPSGTAKLLQTATEKASGIKLPTVLSGRGGGIVGTHELKLMAEEEVLSIEHVALDRAVFARGAILAATWLKDKKPGLYSMQDVLRV